MSGNDTLAMLMTLDVAGSGKMTPRQAADGGAEERPSQREVALHTMLQHSTQEASAEYLLQGKLTASSWII